METKFTKEYAEKLAAEKFPDTTTAGYLDHWSRSSQLDFVDGYMSAIKQTAAPELLEACYKVHNKAILDGKLDFKTLEILINAIKKATE